MRWENVAGTTSKRRFVLSGRLPRQVTRRGPVAHMRPCSPSGGAVFLRGALQNSHTARNGSPHAIDAELVDLVRRHRERADHRIDNLAGRERQNQQSQQQIKSSICHSESPRSGEDTPTRGCTKSPEASLPPASPQDSFSALVSYRQPAGQTRTGGLL
jgi:hypothetical protein